jgi:AbrB family looped-hinge helix DNA binding protein
VTRVISDFLCQWRRAWAAIMRNVLAAGASISHAVLYLLTEMYNDGGAAMAVVTVSQKGWVVIPAKVRAKYHWKSGDRVSVVDYGGVVSLVPLLRRPEEQGLGALHVQGRSLIRALTRIRKSERQREGRK